MADIGNGGVDAPTVVPADFTALRELRDQLGRKFIAGAVLYTGDNLIPFGDKLWLVPLPFLCLSRSRS